MQPPSLRAGWYATLEGGHEPIALHHVVYLFFVPEVGPFLLTDAGLVVALPPESLGWEWHGPYPSPADARAADLAHDPPRHVPPDVWAA